MKYLYKNAKVDTINANLENMHIDFFVPGIRRGFTIKGEKKTFKRLVVRFLFWLATRGRAKVYYATQDGRLSHTSYVIPKCYKFPFLGADDYEIGPCFTYSEYRGRGLYPAILRYICGSVGKDNSTFYMIVDENNTPSIKGIEKAGFEKCGTVKVSPIMKKYRLE